MSLVQDYKDQLAQAAEQLPEGKLAELVDFANYLRARSEEASAAGERELGSYEGKIQILPEFFEPLPEDIQAAFEGRGR